jgi:hypothetical protein
VLEREAARLALLIRRILGPIRLTPVPQVGRPYYQAETALQGLELMSRGPAPDPALP